MVQNPLLRVAARIAYTFNLDPVAVLDADRETWNLRLAAMKVINADLSKK